MVKSILIIGHTYYNEFCFYSDKPCKYFNEGKGTCPFGESCLYKHGMCLLTPFPLSLIISQNYQLISFLAFSDGRLAKSIPRLMTNEDGLSKIVGDVMYALHVVPL